MRLKNGRITIKEVASAAKVSQQTVSRVINERPDVSPETRKRVLDVIEKTGYSPSALARSLIQQRSYTLGIVTTRLSLIGPSRSLSGMTSAAEDAGYALLLKEIQDFNATDINRIFQTLLSRHVDGIIWAVPLVGDNHSWVNEVSLELDIPVVFLTTESKADIAVIAIDNFLGGQMAVNHLLEQGCRHIGHIAGPLDWWEGRERLNGWKHALGNAGLEVCDTHYAEGNWYPASGADAFNALIQQYPEMDAIFVGNDQMALGVLREAYRRGIHIPEQLAVVGFDNITESAYFYPSLTTISQEFQLLGKQAVQNIVAMIEAQKENQFAIPQSILIPPLLVARESSKRV